MRPIYFPAVGGEMEWSAPDSTVYAASFDDPLSSALGNQRLRTALSLDGEWSVTRQIAPRWECCVQLPPPTCYPFA